MPDQLLDSLPDRSEVLLEQAGSERAQELLQHDERLQLLGGEPEAWKLILPTVRSGAVPVLRRALKLKPSLPNTDILLGMSLSEIGRYNEAFPILDKGFHRTSDPTLKRMSGLQLERTYTGLRRDAEAAQIALELNRLYPNDAGILYYPGLLLEIMPILRCRSWRKWRQLPFGVTKPRQMLIKALAETILRPPNSAACWSRHPTGQVFITG